MTCSNCGANLSDGKPVEQTERIIRLRLSTGKINRDRRYERVCYDLCNNTCLLELLQKAQNQGAS